MIKNCYLLSSSSDLKNGSSGFEFMFPPYNRKHERRFIIQWWDRRGNQFSYHKRSFFCYSIILNKFCLECERGREKRERGACGKVQHCVERKLIKATTLWLLLRERKNLDRNLQENVTKHSEWIFQNISCVWFCCLAHCRYRVVNRSTYYRNLRSCVGHNLLLQRISLINNIHGL